MYETTLYLFKFVVMQIRRWKFQIVGFNFLSFIIYRAEDSLIKGMVDKFLILMDPILFLSFLSEQSWNN